MFKTLAVAAGAMLLVGTTAKAADLYTPAPVPSYTGGWYFSGFGGANWLDGTSYDFPVTNEVPPTLAPIQNSYDVGYMFGGAVGYDFGRAMGPLGLRLEGEISYRNNDIDRHVVTATVGPEAGTSFALEQPKGSTSALAGMGNLLFDLNTGGPFTVYGGGGLGIAHVEFDDHGYLENPPFLDDRDAVFAWQAIAGFGYEITPGWVIDLQYRYFNASNVSITTEDYLGEPTTSSVDYSSHAIIAGFRASF